MQLKEKQMILNHKNAFNFILKNASQFKTITRKNIQELHSVIVESLNVNLGFRQKPVGVLGSKYRPLDNMYQITEAVDTLSAAVSRMTTSYAKAIMAVLGISYIQPFEDGNKRTSRLMANALLLSHGLAPLSYRSIDENEYREAKFLHARPSIDDIVNFWMHDHITQTKSQRDKSATMNDL